MVETYKVYVDLPSRRNISTPIGNDFYTMGSAIRFVKEMQLTPSEVMIECELFKGGTKFYESFWLDEDYNVIINEELEGYESE